jgi:hypothetical protein
MSDKTVHIISYRSAYCAFGVYSDCAPQGRPSGPGLLRQVRWLCLLLRLPRDFLLPGNQRGGIDHLPWIDHAIEFGLGHEAELQRSSLEREVVVHREMRDL